MCSVSLEMGRGHLHSLWKDIMKQGNIGYSLRSMSSHFFGYNMYVCSGGRNPRVACSGRYREKRKGKRQRICGVGETRKDVLES